MWEIIWQIKKKRKLYHQNFAQNAAQPTYSGHRACPSSGQHGTAETADTVEHLF